MFGQMLPILEGFNSALALGSIIAMILGTAAGVLIGALPGLNHVMAISLLLPVTYGLEPLVALGLIAGIYNGAMYGGAIPAILLRIPGTPGGIATTFDGYPMAQQGKAAYALRLACWSSAIGGMVSAVALLTLGPALGQVSLRFGPAEYFWVAMLGLTSVGILVGKDPIKGLLAALIGLMVGVMGIDAMSGVPRFTFGYVNMLNGPDIVVVLVGLYALPPVLQMAQSGDMSALNPTRAAFGAATLRIRDSGQFVITWLKSSAIGVVIGILPGVGGTIAALLAYNEAKRSAKDPEAFGKGEPHGVAAAECANNADNAASFIPTLALGVPGNVVAALVMGALLIQGVQPGPRLFQQHPDIVYGFTFQLFLTAALLVVIGGLAASQVFVQLLRLPTKVLVGMVMIFAMLGGLAINGRVFDIYVMIVAGLVGYFLEGVKVPLAPIALGLLLGTIAEQNLRRTLLLGDGNWLSLVQRPLSQFLIALVVLCIIYPLAKSLWMRMTLGKAADR